MYTSGERERRRHAVNKEIDALNVADLTYNEAGLIPCIVQDASTKDVLMMA